jgi:formamidopyrimidine-DNA glycosylase
MPEILEVRRYADFLKHHLKNKEIKEINILKGRYKTHKPFEYYKELCNALPLKVLDVKTKGKFLYFILENNFYIFSTLGLSGGWVFYSHEKKDYKFAKLMNYIDEERMESYRKRSFNNLNVEFVTNSGTLFYYDTLSFGTIKVIDDEEHLIKKLNSIGPDIMEHSTTFEVFKDQINKKNNLEKPIGNVIMNQKVISGIGNYLRADILWLSKISPFRKVKDLSNNELKNIYHNALLLTWGDYDYNKALKMELIDEKDKLPKDYERDFFVYNCEKDIHGHEVVKEELYEGSQKRSIYWVPKVQK